MTKKTALKAALETVSVLRQEITDLEIQLNIARTAAIVVTVLLLGGLLAVVLA